MGLGDIEMAGDTILFRKGTTFTVEGQMFGSDDVPFDYTGAELDLYDTLGFPKESMIVSADDKVLGKFFVDMTTEEAEKLKQGRYSWFKLRLIYEDKSAVVMPPIWIDAE